MHSDVQRLVEAGKISQVIGNRLNQLAPDNFCIHKSFGTGKVVGWDLPNKKITIDFEKSQAQEMDLQFALQKTEWIPEDDFRAKKLAQISELHTIAKKDPVELVIYLLKSHGGSMTGDALEQVLSGTVIGQDQFKRWWETTKKALKESRRVVVPSKRTELLVLRDTDRSVAQTLVADFHQSRDIKGMVKALEAIASEIGAFDSEIHLLQEIIPLIEDTAKKAVRNQLNQALQLIAARDEVLQSATKIQLEETSLKLSDIVATSDFNKFADEVSLLPSARQRRIYESFPQAFSDDWVQKIVHVFDKVGARGVTEIAKILIDHDKLGVLNQHLKTTLSRRSLGADALIWVCRERKSDTASIFSAEVGAAILNLLENDHLADGPRKTTRLQSILTEDKLLLNDLVAMMDLNESRNFARRLLDCPVFADLEKKSLMARIIKAKPETAELVAGNQSKREEALLVSWESLERKKAELDDIIRVRIPQNTKDISVARSYGDLRENFEYKSAKDMQKYLMHRKSELEKDLARARGTDFKGSDFTSVNIGTIVSLKDDASGQDEEITVLGAWDSKPEEKIVSYLSEVGKALFGLKKGEQASIRDAVTEKMKTFTVQGIRAFNP